MALNNQKNLDTQGILRLGLLRTPKENISGPLLNSLRDVFVVCGRFWSSRVIEGRMSQTVAGDTRVNKERNILKNPVIRKHRHSASMRTTEKLCGLLPLRLVDESGAY
jgi:hypothetical protein